MSTQSPTQVKKILQRVLALPSRERAAYLEKACPDRAVREQVMELLADKTKMRSFLEGIGGIEEITTRDMVPPEGLELPEFIGPYSVLAQLGEGGMGVVYLAEQTEPVERRVALKLIQRSFLDEIAEARFNAEKQAMARLSHANVAQMYGAGTTEDGFPYFAMEYVDGPSFIQYCDERRLALEDRLRLFIDICRGVQHAHQRGIIHRDLKPANILVTEEDGKPVPKIIDFGIAKAFDQPLSEATELTGSQVIGTPAYISPETFQLSNSEGTVVDLDTRADVYTLGILLYELLSGERPFETRGLSLAQVMNRILEEDAAPPSARFGSLDQPTGTTVAEARRLPVAVLRRRLQGDLDWIVGQAIAKEREERYGSAAELAADIERHLRDEPVLACPPTVTYRFKKFARRHRAAVIAGAIAAIALVAGVIGISLALVHAQEAQARAVAEARSARQVTDFLVDIFEVSGPEQSRGEEVSARQLLDQGAERVHRELVEQPLIQARMMTALGRVYRQLGALGQAEGLLDEALEIRRRELASNDPEIAQSLAQLGSLYRSQGRLDKAQAVLEESLQLLRDAPEATSELVTSLRILASVHVDRGTFEHGESLNLRALELVEANQGPESQEAADILLERARGAIQAKVGERAEEFLERALAIQEKVLGPDHPDVGRTLSQLGNASSRLDKTEAAYSYDLRALEVLEKALGPDHPEVSRVLSNAGYHLFRMGRYEEARLPLERAVGIDAKVFTHDHAYAASRLTNLGLVYWKLGRLDDAIPLFERATGIRDRVLAPTHPHRATSIWGLANVYRDQERFVEAETLYRQALEIRANALPPEHPEMVDALREYAVLLRRLGRDEEAAALEARIPSS